MMIYDSNDCFWKSWHPRLVSLGSRLSFPALLSLTHTIGHHVLLFVSSPQLPPSSSGCQTSMVWQMEIWLPVKSCVILLCGISALPLQCHQGSREWVHLVPFHDFITLPHTFFTVSYELQI